MKLTLPSVSHNTWINMYEETFSFISLGDRMERLIKKSNTCNKHWVDGSREMFWRMIEYKWKRL